MGATASATKGPLAGPSGSGLKGVRGIRQQKDRTFVIEPIFQNSPGLDAADAKIVGKIAARDIADDATTIGCGESEYGDFGDNFSVIGADEILAPVAPQPEGSFCRKSGSKDTSGPPQALMQKVCLSFLESAKSGSLAHALEQTRKMESSGSVRRMSGSKDTFGPPQALMQKLCLSFLKSAQSGSLAHALEQTRKMESSGSSSPKEDATLKQKLSLSVVQSAKSGALAAAFEQINKEREEKRMKEAAAKLKLCKALVSSTKDGGLAAAFSKASVERT